MGAADEYLEEVGGTEAFSEAVYAFLRKEDGLPLGAPIGSGKESTQKNRWSHNSRGQEFEREERADLEQSTPGEAAQDPRAGQAESTDLQNSTLDEPVVASPKVERVSAPMGALLGLAEQLENMLKEEGAKGWNGNNSESVWDGAIHYDSEFKDIGVDSNAGHVDRQSSGEVRASIESGGASSQGGRRKPLSETSYQQILSELRQGGLSQAQQPGEHRPLNRSKSELACLKMYELAKQKIAAKQREKEVEAEEGEREAKRRGFRAYKKSRQIAQGRLKDANPVDYSEMLYNEAKQIEKKKRALLEALEAERQKELEKCTFAPKITPFVPLYTARHAKEPVVERMQKMVDEQKDRIQQMREEAEKAKAKELTFKPAISHAYAPKRAGDAGSFLKRTSDYLWKKQVSQERVQQEIEAEASLKSVPSINSYSKALAFEEPVHQRLYRSARLREQRSYEEQENRSHDFEVPPTIVRPEQEILQATEKLFGDQDQHQRKVAAAARAQLERTLTMASVKKINQTSVEYAKRKLEKDVRAAFAEVDPECSGIVGQAEIRSVFQKLNVFHKPGARKNRERERSEQKILDRARELMPGRKGVGVDTKAFLGFMELVVEHSLQQQKASFERNVEGRDDVEKVLSPLDKLALDIARRSFHRLSYTQTKVLREAKSNCPPHRAAESRSLSQPLPFSPKLTRPSDPNAPLPVTPTVDRSKTTFQWQSKTGELALVPLPGEVVPRHPTRVAQDAHARGILRKGERARGRVAALRRELELREREACTFRPELVASPRKVRAARSRRTSVRKEPAPPSAITRELQEMGECTFRPKTTTKAPPVYRKPVAKPPALFDRCIERMRRAHARRQQLVLWQETRMPQSLEDTKRVYKRKQTRTEPEPFNFVPGRKRAPIVYIEVILSKSRVARIGIEHGDRPEQIAANFAKIYDLDDQARDHLSTVIRKSVEDILAQKQQAEKDLQEGLRKAEAALARRLSGLMPTLDVLDAGPTQLEAGSTDGALPIGDAAVQQDENVSLEAPRGERTHREGSGDEKGEEGLKGQLGSSVNAHERSGEWAEMVLEDADEMTDI